MSPESSPITSGTCGMPSGEVARAENGGVARFRGDGDYHDGRGGGRCGSPCGDGLGYYDGDGRGRDGNLSPYDGFEYYDGDGRNYVSWTTDYAMPPAGIRVEHRPPIVTVGDGCARVRRQSCLA